MQFFYKRKRANFETPVIFVGLSISFPSDLARPYQIRAHIRDPGPRSPVSGPRCSGYRHFFGRCLLPCQIISSYFRSFSPLAVPSLSVIGRVWLLRNTSRSSRCLHVSSRQSVVTFDCGFLVVALVCDRDARPQRQSHRVQHRGAWLAILAQLSTVFQ